MNLLTLQICKEEAEKMIETPYSWLFNKEETLALEKIKDQGRRTLEVINAYESKLPHRKKEEKFDPEREHQKLFEDLNS